MNIAAKEYREHKGAMDFDPRRCERAGVLDCGGSPPLLGCVSKRQRSGALLSLLAAPRPSLLTANYFFP